MEHTHARFWKAADELAAEGARVTLRAVLQRAGSGSMRDVTKALELWRERTRPVPEIPVKTPETLVSATEQLWKEAVAQANARVDVERKGLAAAVEATESKVAEILDAVQEVEAQRDAFAARLEATVTERDCALQQVTALQAEVAALKLLCDERLQELFGRAGGRRPKD